VSFPPGQKTTQQPPELVSLPTLPKTRKLQSTNYNKINTKGGQFLFISMWG